MVTYKIKRMEFLINKKQYNGGKMKSKFFAVFVIMSIILLGCNKDNTPTNPNDDDNTDNNGKTTIVISGCESGTYNNLVTGLLFTSDGVTITVAPNDGSGVSAIMGSSVTTTGSYTIPNEFTASLLNENTMKMYDLYEGTVNITTLTQTKVQGTLTGKAYQTDMTTFTTDSTKVLNININFATE